MEKWMLGLLFGAIFGFIIHRAGASNPDKLVNMMRWKDLDILKFLLIAIAISAIGFAVANIMEVGNTSIKTAYVLGVGLGGLIFGIGFNIGGYCPGTALVALGEGRKDALFFIFGGLVGAFIYSLIYADLKPMLIDAMNYGKITLADVTGLPAIGIAIVVAVGLTVFAYKVKACK